MGHTEEELDIAKQKERARNDEGKIIKSESIPDRDEIVCPMTFLATNGDIGQNYDVSWSTTMDLTGDGPGCWRSAPTVRPFTDAFYAYLDEKREAGKIPWQEQAYYFTHAQGVMYCKRYIQMRLDGKAKANKKSWGNKFAAFTVKWSEDLNLHGMEAPVTMDDLAEAYPQLYQKKTATYVPKEQKLARIAEAKKELAEAETEVTNENLSKVTGYDVSTIEKLLNGKQDAKPTEVTRSQAVDLDGDEDVDAYPPVNEMITLPEEKAEGEAETESEPSEEDLEEIEIVTPTAVVDPDDDEDEEDEDDELIAALAAGVEGSLDESDDDVSEDAEAEAETVAAATVAEPPTPIADVADLNKVREENAPDKGYDEYLVSVDASSQDVQADSITWTGADDETEMAYLVFVPALSIECWLPLGEYEINGRKFVVKLND